MWTWPIDADATGVLENSAKTSVGPAAAELLAQARLDVVVGARRHLILQPAQLVAKRVGQEVGHDADELADLDEQAAQPDDRRLDAARVQLMLGARGALIRLGAAKAARQHQPDVRQRHLSSHEVRGQQTRGAGHGGGLAENISGR